MEEIGRGGGKILVMVVTRPDADESESEAF